MGDQPREEEVQRRAAALAEDGLRQLVERAAADVQGERLVLVRGPGGEAQEQEEAHRPGAQRHADAKATLVEVRVAPRLRSGSRGPRAEQAPRSPPSASRGERYPGGRRSQAPLTR